MKIVYYSESFMLAQNNSIFLSITAYQKRGTASIFNNIQLWSEINIQQLSRDEVSNPMQFQH
jgi:hypothetical protein